MAKTTKVRAAASNKNRPKKTKSESSIEKEQVPTDTSAKKSKKPVADTLALDKTEQRKVSKETKKIKKGLEDGSIKLKPNRKELKQKAEEKRGLIYVGHIPHGFYEKEMRNYFKQFGKVTNIKLCRSRVSGNSKGFGYVEFEHPDVAKIAAESMNNYIMFKRRIVTEYVPYEKRPKGLFQGKSSNLENTSVKTRRGKQKYSRNKIQDEETIMKKTKKGFRKLQSKVDKLKQLGIQCDLIPVDLSDKSLKEIKLESKSMINVSSRESTQLDNEIVFKKPDSKQNGSKDVSTNSSSLKNSSSKSLTRIRSNKTMLSKSLDSVKALLNKTSSSFQDEETQTQKLRGPKKERLGKNIIKGGIRKVNKERNALTLDPTTVKKIARELIRKKGNPLINLKPSKPRGTTKRK